MLKKLWLIKKIYTSVSLDEAQLELETFKRKYENDQKRIVKKVEDFMQYIEPLFGKRSTKRRIETF